MVNQILNKLYKYTRPKGPLPCTAHLIILSWWMWTPQTILQGKEPLFLKIAIPLTHQLDMIVGVGGGGGEELLMRARIIMCQKCLTAFLYQPIPENNVSG